MDIDSNGIINEDEFINLLAILNVYPESTFEENADRLLNLVDPFNNKQITFSECVTLFANEVFTESDENGNKIKLNILDKISINDIISK